MSSRLLFWMFRSRKDVSESLRSKVDKLDRWFEFDNFLMYPLGEINLFRKNFFCFTIIFNFKCYFSMYYDPFLAAAAAQQAVVNDPSYHRLQVCIHIRLVFFKSLRTILRIVSSWWRQYLEIEFFMWKWNRKLNFNTFRYAGYLPSK